MNLLDRHPIAQEHEGPPIAEIVLRRAEQRRRRRRLTVGAATVLSVGVVATLGSVLASGTGSTPRRAGEAPSDHPVGTSGFHWRRVPTASAPSIRIDAPSAYDPRTNQLVLIGGVREVQPTFGSPVTTTTVLGDTWVFADGGWSQMASGPTPPVGDEPDVLAYDPPRRALVLVTAPEPANGTTRVSRPSTTWTWTGSHWSELLGSGPSWGTGGALMAYDPGAHQLVFVPRAGSARPRTYVLGTSGWRREPEQPGLLQMAYDPVARRLIGEAGHTGSMWWWTGRHWDVLARRVVVDLRSGSVYGMLVESPNWATDEAAGEIVVFGLFDDTTPTPVHPSPQPNLFTWLRGRWHPIDAAMHPSPTNMQFLSLAYDGSVGGLVAFGGGGGTFLGPRTWIAGGNSTWELVRSRS